MNRFSYMFFMIITGYLFVPSTLWADRDLLELETDSVVDSEGLVQISFKIKNISDQSLFQIHPMLHFHHVMSHMNMISSLKPGETLTLVNNKHPRVLRIGRYPLIAMVRYSTSQNNSPSITQSLMSSFYFKEKLQSSVEGWIQSEPEGRSSLLKIFLKNRSQSFKNIRLMLFSPAGLQIEAFSQGMLGFTIRGGEEKQFEFPVNRENRFSDIDYPVHLMIEYGEMQKHYSNEVAGTVHFGLSWQETPLWIHLVTFCILILFLFWVYWVKQKDTVPHSKEERMC